MNRRSLLTQIQLTEGDTPSAPEKIQLFKVGKVYDERYGWIEFTPALLAEIKRNFDTKVRGIDISLDYRHENEDVAAAWFKELLLEENGTELWGKVKWTPRGEKAVVDGEFRYISPEFNTAYVDNEERKKHGAVLLGAALTNRPVIKKMAPTTTLQEGNQTMTLEQALAKIAELEAKIKELEGAKSSGSAELAQAQKELGDTKKELSELKASIEKDKKLAEQNKTFDKMLSEGKAVEAQREHFISGDMVKFAEAGGKVNLNPAGSGKDAPHAGDKDVQDQIMELAEKKIEAGETKDLGEAVKMALAEKPELKKTYEKATQ